MKTQQNTATTDETRPVVDWAELGDKCDLDPDQFLKPLIDTVLYVTKRNCSNKTFLLC